MSNTTPLLNKPTTDPGHFISLNKNKMLSALKSKLQTSPKSENVQFFLDQDSKPEPVVAKDPSPALKSQVSDMDFFKSLDNREADREKISKEMYYIEDLYSQTSYFVDFQANYIQEIEKSLQEVEKNTKQTAAALISAKKSSDCIQKFLYSIISIQSITILVLLFLIWLF